MGNPAPTQTRSVDPYGSYNSDVVNKLTRIISNAEDCILTIDPITTEIVSSTSIKTTSGKCIKDDVLIEVGELTIDLTDSDFYISGSIWDETGYYYVVLEYEYQKTQPAPTASIQIIKDSERSTLYDLDKHIFINCIEITGSYQVVKVYSFDPEDPLITRGTCGGTGTEGSGSNIYDVYEDLLLTSIYNHMTYDNFLDEDLIDFTPSDMSYDSENNVYDFTAGEILQSVDLINTPAIVGTDTVTECMVSVEYTDDGGIPTLEVSTNASDWETATSDEIHQFITPGSGLYIRFTGVGTGTVSSWAILYYPDPASYPLIPSRRKYITFHYSGVCLDEDVIIDGFYFDSNVNIDKITMHARVVPTGSDITIDLLKDGAEQSKLSTLSAGSAYERTILSSLTRMTNIDRFGLKIKTIGSSVAGQGLNIIVHYYDV